MRTSENEDKSDKKKIYIRWILLIIYVLLTFSFVSFKNYVIMILSIIQLIIVLVLNFCIQKKTHINKVLSQNILFSDYKLFYSMPLPCAILDSNERILIYNEEFKDIFKRKNVNNIKINEIIKDYNQSISKQIVTINKENFEIYTGTYDKKNKDDAEELYLIFLVNITENNNLKQQIEFEKTVVALIFIDNYEEVEESIEEEKIPLLTALIDRKLNNFASAADGFVKKLEKDRYVFVLKNIALEKMKERKFDILTDIKEINVGDHIPVTLSIGIGIAEESIEKAMRNARTAIDLALGRGGDQVLIKDGEKYLFYGGKSGEISHNARIRARVKADALSELISESSEVFVMGHRQGDLDSLGSSIGIYRIVNSLEKNCHIVMDNVSVGIKRLYQRLNEIEEYNDVFVSGEFAINRVTENTLVVITDTHRQSIVECVPLLEKANKVVIIDHHRKSTDFIEDAVLIYHEPYASSTSELVTEMINHIDEKIKLKPIEADALLAGITVDTKNFGIKTGAITFEAAAYLRRNGADSIRVRLLFQNDIEVYKAKAITVKDAEVFNGDIAISVCPSNVENSALTAAQAADDLLNIVGIKASFVLCKMDSTIYVSARSFGDINVQIIMEKLGGGGHLTVSGAQIKDVSIEDAKKMVKAKIDEYLKEEN